MNRAQLDALLACGMISAAQHAAALVTRNDAGHITQKPTLDLHVSGGSVTLATEEEDAPEPEAARKLTGTIAAYDQLVPSHGMILKAGSLEARQPLSRVKMLRDHDHSDPVGYMTELDLDTLEASFFIPEGENGDRAIDEAKKGLRDGLSIGFSIIEYEFDDDYIIYINSAEMYEVSLCAIPAIADAGITSVAAALATARKGNPPMNRAQLAAALAAGTIDQAKYDADIAKIDAAEAQLRVNGGAGIPAAEVGELAAGPTPQPENAPVQVADRALSLREVTRRVAAAANTGDPVAVQLALNDVLINVDAAEVYLGKGWIGELWHARQVERPWIDSFGTPAQLETLKVKGYVITERPTVAKYEGDKKAIPSLGKLVTKPEEFTAERWAGGWDIDRAFVDFADEEYLAAFWAAAIEEYKIESDADIAAKVLALTAANTAEAPGVLSAITSLASSIRRIKGARMNRVKLAPDLFDEYASLKQADVPHWLANAVGGVSVQEGTLNVADLEITEDADVPDGTVVGYDNRGARVREKTPIQVRAFDIAKGGIDLGFFSYGLFETHDERVFQQRTVAPAAASLLSAPTVMEPAAPVGS